jgi:circadian clock protein KaiC
MFVGGVALLAQLLGLLVAFIGENLTLRLVREVWPKAPLNDLDLVKGTKMKNKIDAANPNLREKDPEQTGKVRIHKLPTGVRGLDEILGGGIPEFSFNVIAGTPGCGKTTLAHQIVFANATPKKPALYFTVLGEPAMKMLRYQQQYSFFDESKLGQAIRFINLADVLQEGDVNAVLEEIIKQVTAANPSVVVVDSFRTLGAQSDGRREQFGDAIVRPAPGAISHQLGSHDFLVGEYVEEEMRDNPLFTVADGLFWLWQVTERNSVVRKLQVIKLRGQASVPGLHTIRISEAGCRPSRARWDWSAPKPNRAAPVSFHRHSRVGQDDGRRHSRRR